MLICRPEPEAARLAGVFRGQGARTRVLPAIERQPLAGTPEARQTILDLDLYQHIIAVSPYAARLLLERVDQWWPQYPVGLRWYGVGPGSAAVFHEAGLNPETPASGYTSEALLALHALQAVAADRVLLARGEQGRDLIPDTLTQRGARVTTLPLYRRAQPTYPPEVIRACLDEFRPDVVITLSAETLNNFIALSENSRHNCHSSLLLVPIDRVAQKASDAGFSRVIAASGMSDEDIVTRVIHCYSPEQTPEQTDIDQNPDRPDSQ